MSDTERLRVKIEQWTRRLDGPDNYSISQQIFRMVWWSAFYRSINESRRLLPDSEDGDKLANGSLHELAHDGYIAIHAMAIRRLVDRRTSTGLTGVNSLYGLVRDLQGSSDLLTRTNTLEARGLVYDYEPIMQRAHANAWAQAQRDGRNFHYVSGEGWAGSEYWHNTWDKLCGVTESSRQPSDRPPRAKFTRLLDGLTRSARNVENFANLYLAHSASETNREQVPPEDRTVSLAGLWDAEAAILRVAGFVSRAFVTGSEIGGVPIPQFDQFEHLDRPFAVEGARELMEEVWDTHTREVDACRSWDWDAPVQRNANEAE